MVTRVPRWFAIVLVALSLGLQPAAAQSPPQRLTIALAGKALAFIIQYVAIGAGFYKDEGIDPEIVYVASGTRQAAAVMGGSADITQVGLPHGLEAVARGGTLVAIGTGFDKYPIALVLTNDAIKRMGITPAMSIDEKIKRLHGLRIGITSPGSSTDEFMRTIMQVRGMDPATAVRLQPIGIGAPMVAATEGGSIDGFAYMSPFIDMIVNKGEGQIIADPMQDNVPEYKDVPYQVILTSRGTLASRRPLLQATERALTRAMQLCHDDPAKAKRIVRAFVTDSSDADYSAAFDTYVKGVPTTPVITQTQVANTLKMVNLAEKAPINPSFEQVVDNSLAEQAAKDILGK
jgi:ABC-type nitrate/sulfonate/bicarbonate transport system substrate-binding protein